MTKISFCHALVFYLALSSLLLQADNAKADALLTDFSQPSAMSSVALSPSGNLIAFITVEGGMRFVRVLNLASREIVANVPADELDISQLEFISDRYLTLRMVDVARAIGYGRFPVSSRVRIDLQDMTVEPLIQLGRQSVFRYQGRIDRIAGISADGEYVFMPVYMEVGSTDRPDLRLVKVSLESPRDLEVFDRGLRHVRQFWMGPNESVLLQETYNQTDNIHRLWVNRGGDWEVLYEAVETVRTRAFAALTEDYSSIVFMTANGNGRFSRFTMSLADGSVTPLYESGKKDIYETYTSVDGRDFGARFGGTAASYAFSDALLDRFMKQIVAEFEGQYVSFVDWSDSSRRLVTLVSGDEFADIFVMFEVGQPPQVLGYAFPSIETEVLSPISIETFSARDGLSIPTIITSPRQTAQEKLPLVVVPHGGPASNDTIRFDALNQYFAARGAMVIQPQFRGSTGFGTNFLAAGNGEWGDKMQSDVIDVVEELIASGRVDPSKICIVGASFGGYTALMNAALFNDRYRCAASINGVTNLRDLYIYDREFWGRNSEVVSYMSEYMFGGDVSNETFYRHSPVNLAESITADVLLIHSELDFRVPVDQSREMRDELSDNDITVEYVELEGDGHGIRKPANYELYFTRVVEFVSDALELQ